MKLNEAFANWVNDKTPENYETFGASLLPFVNGITKQNFKGQANPMELEDIAGNAVIKVLENLASYQSKAPFHSWVTTIVRNEGTYYLRKEAKRPEQAYTGTESYNPGPSLHNKITLDQLTQNLSHPERVLLQGKLEGVSEEELAVDLKVPIGTVKSRWNTLKAQLRQAGGD